MNQNTQHTRGRCYVCNRPLQTKCEVFLEDDDQRAVQVGYDCFRRVIATSEAGFKTKGGPRVFGSVKLARAAIARAEGR